MPRGALPKTSPPRVASKDRQAKALDLRKAGATYRQIGREMGISHGQACKLVRAALAELAAHCTEQAEEVRRLELERLDVMLLGLWEKARRGEVQAVDRVVKIMERRARLLGLDFETLRHEMAGAVGPINVSIVRKDPASPGP